MANRYRDWLRQAQADLRHAGKALETQSYEWSCFAAQQAAEKAVKAAFQKRGEEAWGHTVTILLGNLSESVEVPEVLLTAARHLDIHYIPSRYPNGFDSGAPADFYTREQAEKAIHDAEQIVEFCRRLVD